MPSKGTTKKTKNLNAIITEDKVKVGAYKKTTTAISNKDGTNINIDLVEQIFETFQERYPVDRIMITGSGDIGYRTLKKMSQYEIDWDELDNYIGDRVPNSKKQKFKSFSSIHVSVFD